MAPSCKSWLANEGGKHLLLLLWLSLNVGLFWKTFRRYCHEPQYFYLHRMLGLGLCLSRASASVLNLNCSLVLLPMCRSLLAFLRGSRKVASRKTRRLLDKSRTFHVTCGVTICFFSVLHVAAHLVNALNFSVNYSDEFLALNAASYHGEDPRKLLFATVPGLTGVLMVLVLFLMSTASTYSIRVSNYDIFWYTHNLFFVFYLLLMLHVSGLETSFSLQFTSILNSSHFRHLCGSALDLLELECWVMHESTCVWVMRGVLKYQTNLKEHPPGCSSRNVTLPEDSRFTDGLDEFISENAPEPFSGGSVEMEPVIPKSFVCTEEPKFQAHFPETWLWISGPLCFYCAERLYRYIRSSHKPVLITAVIRHPCNVLEIHMMKKDFKARPGQVS
ncbi:hypothetical protein lerEdw1_005857 [Lerista edwardsae]|nr:hypothetical protein lerEdw1_005857 [Lerista edwardsae]